MSAAHAPASPFATAPLPAPIFAEPDGPDARLAERVLTHGYGGAAPSVFDRAQVVSFYGYPGAPVMGKLGAYPPGRAIDEVTRVAAEYDALNGARDVIPALHLIVAVAQKDSAEDGAYLARLSHETIAEYVDAARERDVLLFLDVQIGWADPLAEVQRLARFLREPFVHLALDPEFATRSRGVAPGVLIGSLDAAEVNEIQGFLAGLVSRYRLPPKILVLHQFVDWMLPRPAGYADIAEVEITIDMDGYGSPAAKLSRYGEFALAPYAERAAIKLFYDWDAPLLTPARLQALQPPPDLVIYQ